MHGLSQNGRFLQAQIILVQYNQERRAFPVSPPGPSLRYIGLASLVLAAGIATLRCDASTLSLDLSAVA